MFFWCDVPQDGVGIGKDRSDTESVRDGYEGDGERGGNNRRNTGGGC